MKNRLAAVIITCLGMVGSAGAAEFGVGVEFSDDEIRIISAWYRDHGGSSYQGGGKGKHKGLPPGIAKNLQRGKPLPPGIRKNMARGKPMPPGIAKTRLPDPFIGALPRHPGYEWQQAGADLVLVASGSLVISDILEGVFD